MSENTNIIKKWLFSEEYRRFLDTVYTKLTSKASQTKSGLETAFLFEWYFYPFIREYTGIEFSFYRSVNENIEYHISEDSRQNSQQYHHLVIAYISKKEKISEMINCIKSYLPKLLKNRNYSYYVIVTNGDSLICLKYDKETIVHSKWRQLDRNGLDFMIKAILMDNRKMLVSQNLLDDFVITPKSCTSELVIALYEVLKTNCTEMLKEQFFQWQKVMYLSSNDKENPKRREAISKIVNENISSQSDEYRALYALQTAYSIIVRLIIQQTEDESNLFSWCFDEEQQSKRLQKALIGIKNIVNQYAVIPFDFEYHPCDVFGDLYMQFFPASVRHSMGEYFTPSWIADYVVNKSVAMQRLENYHAIDPCCGSGTFLLSVMKKIVGDIDLWNLSASEKDVIRKRILENVHGIDISPISVLSAKANYWLALQPFGDTAMDEIPVHIGDSARFHDTKQKYELIVGNPPWAKLEHLPITYVEKLKAECQTKRLLSGNKKFGGTSLNLCALIANASLSNLIADNGILAFLMPENVLSQNSYEKFRDFHAGDEQQRRFYLQMVDKWTKTKAFHSNMQAVKQPFNTYYISSSKVDYFSGIRVTEIKRTNGELSETISKAVQLSPKTTAFSYVSKDFDYSKMIGDTDYSYRSGVGFTPQELYMLNYVGTSQLQGYGRFFNQKFSRSKYKVNDTPADGWILPTDFVFPLLTAPEITSFHVSDISQYCLIPYKTSNTKSPVPHETLKLNYPELYDYLFRHKEIIEKQSEKSKFMLRGNEFYALSKIGTYTFADCLVAVRDNSRFCATVVKDKMTSWNEKKHIICAKHIIFVSQRKDGTFISESEADYIAGILNSSIVKSYMENSFQSNSYSLNQSNIYLPCYDSENELHRQISTIANHARNTNDTNEITTFENELTGLYLKICEQK